MPRRGAEKLPSSTGCRHARLGGPEKSYQRASMNYMGRDPQRAEGLRGSVQAVEW
ncbi:MAG: hypothetical protein ACLSVD_10265 [Eggerthellaceae bacterium]